MTQQISRRELRLRATPPHMTELPVGLLDAVRRSLSGVSLQGDLQELVFTLAQDSGVATFKVRPVVIQEALMRLASSGVITLWKYVPMPEAPSGRHRRDTTSQKTPVSV